MQILGSSSTTFTPEKYENRGPHYRQFLIALDAARHAAEQLQPIDSAKQIAAKLLEAAAWTDVYRGEFVDREFVDRRGE